MSKTKTDGSRSLRITNIILLAIQCILTIAFLFLFIWMNLTPTRYTVLLAFPMLFLLFLEILLSRWRTGQIASCVLSLILCIVLGTGSYLMYNTSSMLDRITSINTQKQVVNVYVRSDDAAEDIYGASDHYFGILGTLDRDSTDETIYNINDILKNSIYMKEYSSITDLLDGLLNGRVDAIILNESYLSMAEDLNGYKDISSRIKVIYTNEVMKNLEEQADSSMPITKNSFVVYISGIDTTGSISEVSRSDVNILMAVNPVNKKILLISTPRDYYIPLSTSGGAKDKLTHAGTYGIEVSMDTLKMLYNIDIDYYVRLNFTSFVKIIDALGGIRVYSDYSFSADGHKYTAGYNSLNGDEALSFARERYSFAEGDRQRGKNQMAVIEGVIEKLTSSAILKNYSQILESIGSSLQTNISTSQISSLVKMQLNYMGPWAISTYSVNGTGSTEYTYSIPNQKAYVMIPDESTVSEAKLRLKEAME